MLYFGRTFLTVFCIACWILIPVNIALFTAAHNGISIFAAFAALFGAIVSSWVLLTTS